ncbi:hypothetical protein EVG20_g6303 [Dentipellis fragilis]|uniref:BTB domain-containing protein n=1 Tax=Dentipellis fragilis TaxID=205917 RepID=A0A4Y9YQX6_9AGAM|nr:hypothetical protein EVG20_g6303 [Dentipellis fragilis]
MDPKPQNFGPPFAAPDADVVLRSSQWIDFRVHKLILSLASPVFRDMFALPRPKDDEDETMSIVKNGADYVDGLPVVQVSETTTTLQYLLTATYPLVTSLPGSVEETIPVLSAAAKYEMTGSLEAIRATMHIRGMYEFGPERALRVYGLACSHGLEAEALTGAWHTLFHDAALESYGKELCYVSGAALYELMQYRQRAVTTVIKFLENSVRKSMAAALMAFPRVGPCKSRVSSRNSNATVEPVPTGGRNIGKASHWMSRRGPGNLIRTISWTRWDSTPRCFDMPKTQPARVARERASLLLRSLPDG